MAIAASLSSIKTQDFSEFCSLFQHKRTTTWMLLPLNVSHPSVNVRNLNSLEESVFASSRDEFVLIVLLVMPFFPLKKKR